MKVKEVLPSADREWVSKCYLYANTYVIMVINLNHDCAESDNKIGRGLHVSVQIPYQSGRHRRFAENMQINLFYFTYGNVSSLYLLHLERLKFNCVCVYLLFLCSNSHHTQIEWWSPIKPPFIPQPLSGQDKFICK